MSANKTRTPALPALPGAVLTETHSSLFVPVQRRCFETGTNVKGFPSPNGMPRRREEEESSVEPRGVWQWGTGRELVVRSLQRCVRRGAEMQRGET